MDELLLVDLWSISGLSRDSSAEMPVAASFPLVLPGCAYKVDENIHLWCPASLELFQGIGHIRIEASAANPKLRDQSRGG
jgi:hypothetical protein